jgi:hypothetical protein
MNIVTKGNLLAMEIACETYCAWVVHGIPSESGGLV